MLKPIYENIPDDLKQNRQWVNWKSVTRKEDERRNEANERRI